MSVDIDSEMKKMLGLSPSEYFEIQDEGMAPQVVFLESLDPEVREARNYMTFYGYIPCNPETPPNFDGKFFRRENWFKEFVNRFNKRKLPEKGNYVYVEDNVVHLVCVCDSASVEKYKNKMVATIRSYISFLNIFDYNDNKLHLREQDDDQYDLSIGNSNYFSVDNHIKYYGKNAVISFQLLPLSNDQMNALGLRYVEESLENSDEEFDVDVLLGIQRG